MGSVLINRPDEYALFTYSSITDNKGLMYSLGKADIYIKFRSGQCSLEFEEDDLDEEVKESLEKLGYVLS